MADAAETCISLDYRRHLPIARGGRYFTVHLLRLFFLLTNMRCVNVQACLRTPLQHDEQNRAHCSSCTWPKPTFKMETCVVKSIVVSFATHAFYLHMYPEGHYCCAASRLPVISLQHCCAACDAMCEGAALVIQQCGAWRVQECGRGEMATGLAGAVRVGPAAPSRACIQG